jgi:hypothetical protein
LNISTEKITEKYTLLKFRRIITTLQTYVCYFSYISNFHVYPSVMLVRWCHVQKSVPGIFSKITLSHWILFVIMQRLLTAKLCDILSRTTRQWLIQFFNTNTILCSRTSLDVREYFPLDMSLHHSVIWSRHFEGNTFIPNIKNISDNDATSYSAIKESHLRRREYLWTTCSAVP